MLQLVYGWCSRKCKLASLNVMRCLCCPQMLVLRGKTLEELRSELGRWRPNLVYFDKGTSPAAGAGSSNTEGSGSEQLTLCDLSIPSDLSVGVCASACGT